MVGLYSEREMKMADAFRASIHREALARVRRVHPEINDVVDRRPLEAFFQQKWEYPGGWSTVVDIPAEFESREAYVDAIVRDTLTQYTQKAPIASGTSKQKKASSDRSWIWGIAVLAVILLLIFWNDIFKSSDQPTEDKNAPRKESSSYDDRRDEQELYTVATEEPTQPRTHENTNEYISVQTNRIRHAYIELTNDKQREIYENMEYVCGVITQEMYNSHYSCESFFLTGSSRLSSADDNDMKAAYLAFRADNPQVFWIKGYHINDSGNRTNVFIESTLSQAETDSMKIELNSAVLFFHSSVPTGLSAYEREKYIHDYLIGRCTYDAEIKNANNSAQKEAIYTRRPMLSTAYGALCDRDAVCEGYARAFQLLCQCENLDCVFINGYADDTGKLSMEDSGHSWNAVNLSSDWYMVDTTWDDHDDQFYNYFYFNITSGQIQANHAMHRWKTDSSGLLEWNTNLFLPDCSERKYNYYAYDSDCRTITDLDSNQLYSVLMEAVRSGKNTVTLYLDPSKLSFNSAKEALFDRGDNSYANRRFYQILDNTGYNRFEYHYWAEGARNAVFIRFSLS